MFLKNLSVRSFRNIQKLDTRFEKLLNIIYGENAQGKTSVLEAIYYLALTKSFRAVSEKISLKHNESFFDIEGNFFTEDDSQLKIRLFFSENNGKNIFYNENKIKKYSEIIGVIPVVLLSLDDLDITYGNPAKRRQFIDILLSQINPLYLQSLQQFKKSLLHRNQLLKDIKEGIAKTAELYPWDIQICESGSFIIRSRINFVEFLNERLSKYYDHISDKDESINTVYRSNVLENADNYEQPVIIEEFQKLLKENLDRDINFQNTHAGPHKDDLEFIKDGQPLKSFGSQGENKTFLIALKFAESDYIKMKTDKKPLLLLDDIFGELDNSRIQNLITYVKTVGQTFITTTLKEKFDVLDKEDSQLWLMKDGLINEA